MKEILAVVIVLALYTFLALRAGSAILSYRSDWLDAPAFPNRLVKAVLSVLVGYIAAVFFLTRLACRLIVKLFFR